MSSNEPTTGELAIMLKNIEAKIDTFHEDQKTIISDVKANTKFRIQSTTIVSLVKWLGFGQVLTMIYLAMQFLGR